MRAIFAVLLLAVPATAKTRLAVSPLKSSFHAASGCSGNYWGGSLGRGLAEQLLSELQNAGRFELLDRPKGAHYRIEGAVTEFELCASGGKARADVGKLFKLKGAAAGLKVGAKTSTAKVTIDLRVVDENTGVVTLAFAANGSASAGGLDFAGQLRGAGFGSEAFYRTPLGEATREALREAAQRIAKELPEGVDAPEAEAAAAAPRARRAAAEGAKETSYEAGVVCAANSAGRFVACKPLEASASGASVKALEFERGREVSLPIAKVLRLAPLGAKPRVGATAIVSCKRANFCFANSRQAAKLFASCRVVDSFESSAMVQCGSKQFDVAFDALFSGAPIDPKSL